MKKTQAKVTMAVALVTVFLLLELVSANPILHSVTSDLEDGNENPVFGDPGPVVHPTVPSFTDFDASQFADTESPEYEKINGEFNVDELDRSVITVSPVSGGINDDVAGNWEAGIWSTSLAPNSAKAENLVVTLKPDSLAGVSLITTSAPVSVVNDVGTLITSSESVSVPQGHHSFVTTLEPDSLSTIVHIGDSPDSATSSTTSETDSKRRGGSVTTLKPEFHDADDKLPAEPVTKESKNGASDVRSSLTMILLAIFFVVGFAFT